MNITSRRFWSILILAIIVGSLMFFAYSRDTSEPSTTLKRGHHTIRASLLPSGTPQPAPETRYFEISGNNFAYSQKTLTVNRGDTVRITFTSTEGRHDLVIDEFNAFTKKVSPGTETRVEFVADRQGTFRYYSSVDNQRDQGMIGTLIVQ